LFLKHSFSVSLISIVPLNEKIIGKFNKQIIINKSKLKIIITETRLLGLLHLFLIALSRSQLSQTLNKKIINNYFKLKLLPKCFIPRATHYIEDYNTENSSDIYKISNFFLENQVLKNILKNDLNSIDIVIQYLIMKLLLLD
jgi:hypothetical protein